MSRIDLNIVDRGTSGTTWTAEDVALSANHLDKVMEQKTDNCGSLNSLPTPFARFFVAREAFRRASKKNEEIGFAYRQIVSDVLDVYELLFNLKYHKNNTWKNGESLEIREWDSKENLAKIKANMPVLYNAIENYYNDDIREEKLYFVVFLENGKEKLLACSSPLTGFVTPPDMDKSNVKDGSRSVTKFAGEQYDGLRIRRKSGGTYFTDVKMFDERDSEFKNYMFSLFKSDNVDSRFNEIKGYIRSFANDEQIRNDSQQKLENVTTEDNNPLIINGLSIYSCDDIDVNSFFTDYLIKLPYRIDRNNFKSVVYDVDKKDRDYDYLLPFKPEVFTLFEDGNINSVLHVKSNRVAVTLTYNEKEYTKEYSDNPDRSSHGIIKDLKGSKISVDLGIFPNILSHRDEENDYFKVLVVGADEDPESPQFNIDKINLTFFKKNGNSVQQIYEVAKTEDVKSGVLPAVVRSQQKKDNEESGTKFYELFNTSFDIIEVNVMGCTGVILPIWNQSKATNDTYTYAIDLGTSNTFMARCKNEANGNPDLSKKPEMFKMDRSMVNYMHEPSDSTQYSLVSRIENSIFDKAKNKIKTEFVPAMIDGMRYKFPVRTALCGINDRSRKARLFDNHNIAFFYEKMMANEDQNVQTDIKWEKNEEMLRIYVKELLLIIKCDILQRNGDLDRTNLIWFSPLSFSGEERDLYQDIWNSEPKSVLHIDSKRVRQYSESEAPYYYYKYMDYIKDSDAATVIDIGGGSTDFVYFKDNKPVAANSVHFGCDVLWENGFVEFGNERKNGIYNKYAGNIQFGVDELQKLNDSLISLDSTKTKDIINFWISNENQCEITKNMRRDFRPLFVYHLTSILFYMANMYKDNGLQAPKTIVFSGNGSKYIDSFISSDNSVLRDIINTVFEHVYGEKSNVNLELPDERKESTCYGGLYRGQDLPNVEAIKYQGDTSHNYQKVSDINTNFNDLKNALGVKYSKLASLYKDIIDLLKQKSVIDGKENTSKYVNCADTEMLTSLSTYYKSQVKEKYSAEVHYNDSVFFLPIIKRVFEMTKI